MLFCITCSSVFIYVLAHNQAKLQTDNQVSMAKSQAQLTLQPLMLTKDTLSMNIYLRTLAQAPFINGITLVNTKKQLLARAGSNIGDAHKAPVFSQQLAIGELTFFINKQPANLFFEKLLWVFLMLAVLSAVFTLATVGFFAKRILRQFSLQYKPLLEHRFSMELEQVRSEKALPTAQINQQNTSGSAKLATSLAIVDLDAPHRNPDKTNTNKEVSEPQIIEQRSETETPITSINSTDDKADNSDAQPTEHSANKHDSTQQDENQELVSLLKPDTQKRMPHFKPFGDQNDAGVSSPSAKPEIITHNSIELIEEDLSHLEKPKKNPLLHPHEEQLDLYSLEHQSELNLKAADAAYILFIDCSSNRVTIEDADEHQTLLSQYRKLVKLVVKIYGGKVELLANGDIRVLFNDTKEDDGHGIQALCAAKLFNQLYKYYNHRQITRMQPTLNIQISLVRGNREKLEILREECHFLTRTTLTNELISHTPLSEVQALKDTLLDNAITQRQEEDKILILELSSRYQELLEKQARHLVKSL
jgi:hypothetical protein